MSESASMPVLAGGRQVSMLPCAGGASWVGTVQDWEPSDDTVVARIQAGPDAVATLDHHQMWLSTVGNNGHESGITIFAGRAYAIGTDLLRVEGVVRLLDERRRAAVRATGCRVTLPATGGPERMVPAIDVSRGGVRLPVGPGGWTYADPLDLVVHLEGQRSINVAGWLLRIDMEARLVILRFDDLSADDAAALDRYALSQLPGREQVKN